MTAEEFFRCLDFEERTYYYHITGAGVGEIICDEGLAMADSHVWSTMIEITPDLIEDLDSFLSGEYSSNSQRGTEEMVIIGVDKGSEGSFITKNDIHSNSSWTMQEDASYLVPKANILGYIDLTDPEYTFNANPNCFAYELEESFPQRG